MGVGVVIGVGLLTLLKTVAVVVYTLLRFEQLVTGILILSEVLGRLLALT